MTRLNNEYPFFCKFRLQSTVQSINNLMRNNDDVDEGTLQKWDDRYVHLLIEAYNHYKHLLNSSRGKVTKKQVFERIAEYFNATADVTVSGDQCLRKWTKLEQKYKEVEDNNKRTGKGRKDWKFLDKVTDCLGQSPKVNPAFTFDASSERQESRSASQSANSYGNCSDSSGDDADADDENVVRKELKPRRQRKRKSNSSAAEMLTFLQTYTEKREKAEEEKLNLLREMKDEKKQFFSQFLEILKNK